MNLIFGNDAKAVDIISAAINLALPKGNVLFLVSGGSNIDLAVKIIEKLDQGELTISLIDERYGAPGHPDSNWQKLLNAGLAQDDFTAIPILCGDDIAESTNNFEAVLSKNFKTVIGLLGMGEDGHTAGILPNSQVIDSTRLADFYSGPDFERITITPNFFDKIDQAFLVVKGNTKKQQLNTFLDGTVDYHQQPVQLLKRCKSATIISDLVEGKNE